MEKWISSFIPFGQLVLEPGTMNCETDVKLGTGAILGYVYLGIVAFLVVLGKNDIIIIILTLHITTKDRSVLFN